MSELANTNEILMYLHCALCLQELPSDQSPKEWARVQAGWTKQGLQVWCNRHEANVIHIDFEGMQHPANVTRRKEVVS